MLKIGDGGSIKLEVTLTNQDFLHPRAPEHLTVGPVTEPLKGERLLGGGSNGTTFCLLHLGVELCHLGKIRANRLQTLLAGGDVLI
jgi:hypothetical protein